METTSWDDFDFFFVLRSSIDEELGDGPFTGIKSTSEDLSRMVLDDEELLELNSTEHVGTGLSEIDE